MKLFKLLSNYFKSHPIEIKNKLDVANLLPKHFITGPHRKMYVLSVQNPDYKSDSNEPEYIDCQFIKLKKQVSNPWLPKSGSEIEITLFDNLSEKGTTVLMNWVRDSMTNMVIDSETDSKIFLIKEMDQVGNVTKTITMKRPLLSEANFHDLNHENSDSTEIDLTIRFA